MTETNTRIILNVSCLLRSMYAKETVIQGLVNNVIAPHRSKEGWKEGKRGFFRKKNNFKNVSLGVSH